MREFQATQKQNNYLPDGLPLCGRQGSGIYRYTVEHLLHMTGQFLGCVAVYVPAAYRLRYYKMKKW